MRTSISLLFTFTLFFNSFFSLAFAAESGVNKVFTLGMISTKPKKRIKASMPLVNYIVSQMPEYNSGRVVVRESVEEMSDLLQRGEVSMFVTTPYAALLIERQGSAKIRALRWKHGVESYQSVIFARNDKKINTLRDLLGKTIIFEKDSSTSAFFAPSVHLLEQGFELQKLRSLRDRPAPNKIGYLFINEHLRQSNEVNMSIWVFHKRLDAAAFSNLNWKDPETTPTKAREKMHIIAKTAPFPRGVILLPHTADALSQQVLLQVLFDANNHLEGKNVMAKFQKTSQFAPVPESLNKVLNQARQHLNANPDLFK